MPAVHVNKKVTKIEKDNSHCLHKWLELWSTHNA